MSGGKVGTASRLFGNAMAGVRDPKQRVAKAAAKPAAVASRPAAPERTLGLEGEAGQKKARGRGSTSFGGAGGSAANLRRDDETWEAGLDWGSGGGGADSDRWQHDRFEDGMSSGPMRRGRGNRRSGPYRGAERVPMDFGFGDERRWEHDQFQGPGTVGSSVFVRNLPMEVADEMTLTSLFEGAGHVVSVQVDPGPVATATIGFLRQDAAAEAEALYHGRWVHGCQVKVSVKDNKPIANGGDEDFWRKELKAMPKRREQDEFDRPGRLQRGAPPMEVRDGVRMRGRGTFAASGGGRASIWDRMG